MRLQYWIFQEDLKSVPILSPAMAVSVFYFLFYIPFNVNYIVLKYVYLVENFCFRLVLKAVFWIFSNRSNSEGKYFNGVLCPFAKENLASIRFVRSNKILDNIRSLLRAPRRCIIAKVHIVPFDKNSIICLRNTSMSSYSYNGESLPRSLYMIFIGHCFVSVPQLFRRGTYWVYHLRLKLELISNYLEEI